MKRRIVIIAEPNRAGKTTFAHEFLPKEAGVINFINADLIASGLSPFDPDAAAFQAGRVMLMEMRRCLGEEKSFTFETTLSGRWYAQQIPKWRNAGYQVDLVYLKLRSIRLAISRVKARVAKGGHHVPAGVVRRRFQSGWVNFETAYRPIVDRWELYDNSDARPIFLAGGDNR